MKYKIIWTADLHKKFLKAVQKLGVDNAVPKKIVELMKVKGLTRDHVASHLQKYRILSKKIANAYYQAQTSSNSSLIFKHEQKNWPSYNNGMYMMNPLVLDTSSSYFPVLESSNFNSTVSFEFAHLSSLPNEGYSMPVMTKNLDEQGKLYDDAYNMGVVSSENSSNSWFMQNLDGFIYDYGACSTNVYSYNNTEMGSSSGVHLNKELAMCWNHEKPISIGKSSNSSFVESSFGFERNYFGQNEFVEMGSSSGVHLNKEIEMNMNYKKPLISTRNSNNSYFVESSIGFESNYIGQNECVEMGSCYGSNSKSNLENGIVEDDLMLNEDAMAFLLSYADGHGEYGSSSNNLALQHPNQDMKVNDQHFLDIGSFDSNLFNEQHSNEEIITKGYQQTLDGYIPTFDPTFNMPMWSPELLGDHMIYEDLFFDPFIED